MLRGYLGLPGATSENKKKRVTGPLGLLGALVYRMRPELYTENVAGLPGATWWGYRGYLELSCRMRPEF
jgi:hypothetical protein